MNTIQKHERAVNLPMVHYHKFLNKYKICKKTIFIFCEGEEDIGYYSHAIKQMFPQLDIVKFFVGGKRNVLEINRLINWDRFNRNQILFFVDRDMSYWLKDTEEIKNNVYVTDEYSFENDLIKEEYFISYLEDLSGFNHASYEELKIIRELFACKWSSFLYNSKYIMAVLAVSIKNTGSHLAKHINHKKMIKVGREKIWVDEYEGQSFQDYVTSVFQITETQREQIEFFVQQFGLEPEKYSVRGKWALSFFVKMINHVIQNGSEYAPSLYKGDVPRPKSLINLDEENAVTVLGPRVIIKESLQEFCKEHISAYLKGDIDE